MHLSNPNPYQGTGHSIIPESCLRLHSSQNPPSTPEATTALSFFHHRSVWPVLKLFKNGIILYVFFHVRLLLLLSVVFLRFMHVFVSTRNSFLYIAVCYTSQFDHSPLKEHLRCFQYLAMMHKAVMKMLVQVTCLEVDILISLR